MYNLQQSQPVIFICFTSTYNSWHLCKYTLHGSTATWYIAIVSPQSLCCHNAGSIFPGKFAHWVLLCSEHQSCHPTFNFGCPHTGHIQAFSFSWEIHCFPRRKSNRPHLCLLLYLVKKMWVFFPLVCSAELSTRNYIPSSFHSFSKHFPFL